MSTQSALLKVMSDAARKAARGFNRDFGELAELQVSRKGAADFVSAADIKAEQSIFESLTKARPGYGFLGEERGLIEGTDKTHTWIVDPLDGTTNFLRGIPHYAVSIACLHKGKLEHAVIVDPVRHEEFTASRGRGAQLNGRRMRVSQRPSLEGALLGTGIPFKDHCDDKLGAYSKTIEILAGQCAGIRRAGAASLDLAYVAAGRLDAFWEIGLAPWDMAAGALLIREAGGLVADIDSSENFLASGNIVAGSPKCFKAVLQTIRPLLS
jgi:myo-inositol-1(or 4)-monophosphatase